jgi:ADP-ribose pyrophosphatase YjhB (NUDIX family)
MREAREEAGIILEKSKMKLLEVLEFPNWSEEHHGLSFVYGTNIDEKTPIKINDESEGFKWFEINNLPDSMLDPKEFILQAREKAKRLL